MCSMGVDTIDYTRRLTRLLEVCKNLSSNLELEPLLQSLLEVASELTHSESSSILTYDEENGLLKFLAVPWHLKERASAIGVPLDASAAGWVFLNRQPMLVQDAQNDRRIFRAVDLEWNNQTRSLLAVPLCFRGQTIGVFECTNKAQQANYTEEDVFILETLAAQAAIAIRNRHLLEQSRQAYEKALESDRLKGDFIAIMSHELRTPLGVVLGHSALLRDMAPENLRVDLDVIAKSAMRLKEIIEDFSNVDRIEAGLASLRRQRVVISTLVQSVVDSFKDLARDHQIALDFHVSQRNLALEGDESKIAIALSNLVRNALTFTNPGGQVQVRAEQVPGYIKIAVIDDGIGIPAAEQEKIFERFYQVEKHLTRRHGGMGLGLSIAREFIELHGGRIWVESTEGKGSRFTFLLPKSQAEAAAAGRVFGS